MISRNLTGRIGILLGPLVFLFIIVFPLPQLNDLSFDVRIVLALTI
jgi:hypothetical protein